MVESYNIGNFLKVDHIERAFKLINLQIEDDKFSFKTLEFEIYRKDEVTKNFDCLKFYNDFIKKDQFYNNNKIFYNIDYLIPKGVYGARKFNFLSFEMLILYYGLGFYIFDLVKDSYEVIETKKENRANISTYYGGKINFKDPEKSMLYYKGIPLFSQNILSNFLSYLYLFELDNFVQNLKVSIEDDFIYCRYVDDFYLIYKRNKELKNDTIGDEIFDITTSISEFLYDNLGLKINELKTQALIISDADDFEKFIKKEKVISIPNTLKKDQKPLERLEEIKAIVEKLKKDYRSNGKVSITTQESNKLKEIFSTSMKQYLNSANAKILVDKMFLNWYPVLTLSSTQALIYLLKHSNQNKLLKYFLIDKMDFKLSNPQYLFLLEKYLLSNKPDTAFTQEIIDIKESNSYLTLIKRMLDSTTIVYDYEDISINCNVLTSKNTLMQQIKMLTLAEIEGKYNLAFNHLLNIYHYYCYTNDPIAGELKNYNKINVTDFLDGLGLSIKQLNFSMQFFDRRNKNNISHAGEELMESWAVNRDEYNKYKIKLNKLLIKIQEFLK